MNVSAEKELIEALVEVDGSALCFVSPPAPFHLKFFPVASRWVIFVRAAPEVLPSVAAWVARWANAEPRWQAGERPTVLRVVTDELPAPWPTLVAKTRISGVSISPDGRASIAMSGPRHEVIGLVSSRPLDASIRVKQIKPVVPPAPLLTDRQRDVLRAAVDAGYYAIPRKLNLLALARRLSLSAAATSELLRRAESRIITAHIQAIETEVTVSPLVGLDPDELALERAVIATAGGSHESSEQARRREVA